MTNNDTTLQLSTVLNQECTRAGVHCQSKKRALEIISELAAKQLSLPSQVVFEAILTREKMGSTGIGNGIAIPHAKTDAIDHSAISIARLVHPVDWGSLDGQPVDLVIMLTLNAQQGADEHLRIFSRLARRMMYDEFRQQLRQAPNAAALCALLRQELEM